MALPKESPAPAGAAVTCDVAIVGFGPSGAVAAGLLGQAGLSVYVCEKQREVYDKPRAIAIDHEIMRVMQQLGLVDAIAPWVEPFTPSEFFGIDGQLVKRMTMVPPPYPMGYTPSMVFTQPPVERALRAHAASMANVTLDLGVELQGLEPDQDGVTLGLRGDDGSQRTVRARYAIGCDGASSAVRAAVGIELSDLDFDEPWLVADVLVNERGLAKLPTTSVQYCEADRPCTMVIGPKNHRRWEISLKAGEDPKEAASPEGTWRLLSRWITPDDGELWRQASYRFHALLASEWRKGRVFIAGDAAHQQPPFLGQGMCQGVRDVANLAWKLAAVLQGEVRGEAAERLLDSYGVERRAHVRELTTRIKAIGAVICERDPDKARERDRALLAACGGVVQDTPRQDVIPKLEGGCFSALASSARGSLFPQPSVAAADAPARLMDSRCGYGWRLVFEDALMAAVRAELASEVATGRPVTAVHLGLGALRESDGLVAAWMKRHECHAALVRPDHYVFGVARDAAGLRSLLDEMNAALA